MVLRKKAIKPITLFVGKGKTEKKLKFFSIAEAKKAFEKSPFKRGTILKRTKTRGTSLISARK